MAKMSKTQRAAILEAHAFVLDHKGSGTVHALAATERVLRRNKWIDNMDRVTRDGLTAAGVDMDALADEALDHAAVEGRWIAGWISA